MYNKKKIAIYLLLILIVISDLFIFFLFKKEKKQQNKKERIETIVENLRKFDEIKLFYVIQSSQRRLEKDISFSELDNSNIAVDSNTTKEFVLKKFKNASISIFQDNQYDWAVNNNWSGYFIVPIEKADKRLKSLSYRGINPFFDTQKILEYELVEIKNENDSKLSDLNSNFDFSKIVQYVAGGEIIPARAVARKFRRLKDYTFPFKNVKEIFNKADFASVILENSISGSPEPCYGCVSFLGDEKFVTGLNFLGVDLVATCGNHMLDKGVGHIKRTNEVLEENSIMHVGSSYLNQIEASKFAKVQIKEVKMSFLGYDDVAYYAWASLNSGGTARASKLIGGRKNVDFEKIKDDVEKAKNNSDIVVVLISWGDREYINKPLPNQVEMAHAFIDSGVDLIIGTHQHWVNSIEYYKDGIIFYGLGNFVFDQTHTDPTRQSFILRIAIYDKKVVSYDILPIESCGPQQQTVDNEQCDHFTPYFLKEKDKSYKEIYDRIFQHSKVY